MIFPQGLKKGDYIGIFASSSPVSLDSQQIKKGYEYIEKRGLKIVEGKNLYKESGHTAGSIKDRVESIHGLFKDKRVAALMSFWGGHNSNELLDHLDFNLIKRNPKIFIGYSDTTVLSTAINRITGLITFSGPALISFIKPEPFEYTWDNFLKMTTGREKIKVTDSDYYADDLYFQRKNSNHRILKKNSGLKVFSKGKAKGTVVGGNLQSLLALAGTKYFPELKNSVLFLEEAEDASVAMIYRFLTQLRQHKEIDKVRAIVFGRFMEHSGFKKGEVEKMLRQIFSNLDIPILYDADFGHSDPVFTIPVGSKCEIDTSKKSIVFSKAVK